MSEILDQSQESKDFVLGLHRRPVPYLRHFVHVRMQPSVIYEMTKAVHLVRVKIKFGAAEVQPLLP